MLRAGKARAIEVSWKLEQEPLSDTSLYLVQLGSEDKVQLLRQDLLSQGNLSRIQHCWDRICSPRRVEGVVR